MREIWAEGSSRRKGSAVLSSMRFAFSTRFKAMAQRFSAQFSETATLQIGYVSDWLYVVCTCQFRGRMGQ